MHFCSRTESEIKSAETSLRSSTSQSSPKVSGAVVDVSKQEQVDKWIAEIIVAEKSIDIIVSNVSSLSIPNHPESWASAYQTDMMGTVSLVNASLPHLEKSKGNIVTISSVSGRDVDFTAVGPYGTFKAALIHYTAQLAHTLAPKGVRANTVSPGNIYIADGVWGGVEKNNPEFFKSQMAKNPMGRMGKPEEIANTVLFLASEKASFISGANLVVDGALCTGVQF